MEVKNLLNVEQIFELLRAFDLLIHFRQIQNEIQTEFTHVKIVEIDCN